MYKYTIEIDRNVSRLLQPLYGLKCLNKKMYSICLLEMYCCPFRKGTPYSYTLLHLSFSIYGFIIHIYGHFVYFYMFITIKRSASVSKNLQLFERLILSCKLYIDLYLYYFKDILSYKENFASLRGVVWLERGECITKLILVSTIYTLRRRIL